MATPAHTDRLPLRIHEDGSIEGRTADRVRRTHSAHLWFLDDIVVKRKRPVELGFLDFRSLESRIEACEREVELNRRLGGDTYLGVADVVDDDDTIVDAAVVMRRLPDEQRLSTRALAGDDLSGCVRQLGRELATFHADQPAAPEADVLASAAAVRTNWEDNLAVLADHPELADPALVADLAHEARTWLDGRDDVFAGRIAAGMVRDGHGDLVADDVFCLPDGPRVLDCLDFSERYRIGDVLLDLAFLTMDLQRLGRPDLAAALVDSHESVLGTHHPRPLLHHYIAYRAGVRAKVACLADDPFPQDVGPYLDLMAQHLFRARTRLVLVGGLPGTGKSTLAAGLADRLDWVVLRSDEVRKDMLGQGHDLPAGPQGYSARVTAATYAELLDRASALLGRGQSVVVDATWSDAVHRDVAAQVAEAAHCELVAVHCTAPGVVARRRVEHRRGDVSDADSSVHDTMAETFAPWPQAHAIDTDQAPNEVVVAAMKAIGMTPAMAPKPGAAGSPSDDPASTDAWTGHEPDTPPTHTPDTDTPDTRGLQRSAPQHQEDTMPTRPTDRQGLEVLDPDTCLQLLDLSPVGRIAFISAGEPVILPVNHVRDGLGVAFRTTSGLTMHAATVRASMAFEVDGYDEETRTGWSVLLRGRCDLVDDDEAIARLDALDLHPWADDVERPHWVRLGAAELSGRRIPDRHAEPT